MLSISKLLADHKHCEELTTIMLLSLPSPTAFCYWIRYVRHIPIYIQNRSDSIKIDSFKIRLIAKGMEQVGNLLQFTIQHLMKMSDIGVSEPLPSGFVIF